MKYFVYAIIAIVLIAVVAGFFIVGSPTTERARRFDQQRVGNLEFLQSEIVNYWVSKSKLPVSLDLLKDDIRGIAIPTDPETNQPYSYKITGPVNFQLCADFNLPSLSAYAGRSMPMDPYFVGQTWSHKADRVCFDRTIDKDFYKLAKPIR